MKKFLKNQKGLTLVELLAVIVILGIIAAIAVPAIANIIDNSRKDAHVANAEALYDAARLAVVGEDVSGSQIFVLDDGEGDEIELLTLGYLETDLEDPDGGEYGTVEVDYDSDGNTYTITMEPVFPADENLTINDIREAGRDGFDEDGDFGDRN